MDRADLGPLIRDGWERTCFRLEALDRYEVHEEQYLLSAYLRGEPVRPHDQGLEWWLEKRRDEYAQGKRRTRVHAIAGPLTPYLGFEIEWAYTACVDAGEDIRILQRGSWAETPFGEQPQDFYILDDKTVVLMTYDAQRRWVSGELINEPAEVARYRRLRDRALADAVPLAQYLKGAGPLVALDVRRAALRRSA